MPESHLDDNVIATAEESRKAIRLLLLFSVIGFLLIDRVSRVPDQTLLADSLELLDEFSQYAEPGDWAPAFAFDVDSKSGNSLSKEKLRAIAFDSPQCGQLFAEALSAPDFPIGTSASFYGMLEVSFLRGYFDFEDATVGSVVDPVQRKEKMYVDVNLPDLSLLRSKVRDAYPGAKTVVLEYVRVCPIDESQREIKDARDAAGDAYYNDFNEFFFRVYAVVDGNLQKVPLDGFLPSVTPVSLSVEQFLAMVGDGVQSVELGASETSFNGLNVPRAIANLKPFLVDIQDKSFAEAKEILEGRDLKEWTVSVAGFTFQGGAAAMALVLGYAVLFTNLVANILSLRSTPIDVRTASLSGFPWIEACGWFGAAVFILTNVALPGVILYQVDKYAWSLAQFHSNALPLSMPGDAFKWLLIVISVYTMLVSLVCLRGLFKLVPSRP